MSDLINREHRESRRVFGGIGSVWWLVSVLIADLCGTQRSCTL